MSIFNHWIGEEWEKSYWKYSCELKRTGVGVRDWSRTDAGGWGVELSTGLRKISQCPEMAPRDILRIFAK